MALQDRTRSYGNRFLGNCYVYKGRYPNDNLPQSSSYFVYPMPPSSLYYSCLPATNMRQNPILQLGETMSGAIGIPSDYLNDFGYFQRFKDEGDQDRKSDVFHFTGHDAIIQHTDDTKRNINNSLHKKEMTTKCSICEKVYSRSSTLKIHLRTHTGERPFKCNVCSKSFSQNANLRAHLRIHTGEKPFKCSVCDKSFTQSSSLTLHMRVHSGERPYRCNICLRGFACSSTLTKHLRIHTGEKPYQCKVCDMRFSQSGNLSRHMRLHEKIVYV
ncbi:zinc finger protein 239-like [Exaiptasia diaphana]|uniref:C2H2-type domain-containing protein n=1 Tax=Exaiptasia diaphana TaxID=2652724 RepID=A0A913X734_EXADI|nr:zinc finger protein 239-like [Exaiptasia diaphana]XP_020899881.1 zinc finger protein 239-like [Exaiptasia diaphana]